MKVSNHQNERQNYIKVGILSSMPENYSFNFQQERLSDYSFHQYASIEELHKAVFTEKSSLNMLVLEPENLTSPPAREYLNEILGVAKLPFLFVISSMEGKNAPLLRQYFKTGARDILIKPFGAVELMVKIENILLSNHNNDHAPYLANNLTLKLDGKKVEDLTIKQAQLLSLFLKSPNRTAKRDEIKQKVWQNISIHPKTIDVHLYNLRRKLANYGYMIKSVGSGRWSLTSTLIVDRKI